jgi:hypothetical protein
MYVERECTDWISVMKHSFLRNFRGACIHLCDTMVHVCIHIRVKRTHTHDKESLICDTCTRYSDSVFNSHVVIFKISGMTYSFIRILVMYACICVP